MVERKEKLCSPKEQAGEFCDEELACDKRDQLTLAEYVEKYIKPAYKTLIERMHTN